MDVDEILRFKQAAGLPDLFKELPTRGRGND